MTSDQQIISSVKDSTLGAYPGKTIGKAFDDFFSIPVWSEFEATGGEQVVEFCGKCTYQGETVTAKLQFLVEDDSFSVYALKFNDIPQTNLVVWALFEKIYE